MLRRLLLALLLLIPALSFAELQPLPIDQAFQFTIQNTTSDSIIAHWTIAPGYYLYKDRLSFSIVSPKQAIMGKVFLPAGIEKTDDILGKHQVYENQLAVPLPLINPTQKNIALNIAYQGCSSSGFCYPPVLKRVNLAMDSSLLSIDNIAAASNNHNAPTQKSDATVLQNSNPFWSLVLFFGFGLLLAFTPCVLPMLPILSGIIVGQGADASTKKAFFLSLTYVLSMALTFAIAGIIVALLGKNIQAALQNPWVLSIFSLLFVILALSLFGFYELQLPAKFTDKITRLSQNQRAGNYIGVAIMGCLATLIVSPCVSAPLVGALAYIGKTGNVFFGGSALFFMGLGMGLPLLIVGTTLGKYLPKAGAWLNVVKIIFGILLLGVAISLISRLIPANIALMLWGCLIILTAVYLGIFNKNNASNLNKFGQALGIILLIYGGTLLVGGAMGNSNILKPLAKYNTINAETTAPGLVFTPVKTVQDVKQQIQLANKAGKKVMLDFYADWCVSCKEMAATTFADPKVKTALNNYVLLQADVTANDADDKALEKYFNVIAPPTVLFFATDGKEITAQRIIGETGPEQFLQHLN